MEKPGSPGTITDFVRWGIFPITCHSLSYSYLAIIQIDDDPLQLLHSPLNCDEPPHPLLHQGEVQFHILQWFSTALLQAAYSFYNVSTATPWVDLMGDALVSQQTNLFGFGCCKCATCPCYLIQRAFYTFTHMLSDARCLLKERTLMSSTPWISWRTGVVVNDIYIFAPAFI